MGGNIPDVGGTTSRSGRKLGKAEISSQTEHLPLRVTGVTRTPTSRLGNSCLCLSSIFSSASFASLYFLFLFLLRFIGGVPIKPPNCQLQQGWSKRVRPEV